MISRAAKDEVKAMVLAQMDRRRNTRNYEDRQGMAGWMHCIQETDYRL